MRAEDLPTFEQFVAVCGPRLLGTALILSSGDRGHAEDLLQQALAKVARQWSRIDVDAEAYTRMALTRLSTDRWRRRRARVTEVSASPDREPIDPRATDDLHSVELRDTLWSVLRELPPKQRAVIALRHLDDLTEAETAKALGVPIGTVKSTHSRALARLRELLPTDPTSEVTR